MQVVRWSAASSRSAMIHSLAWAAALGCSTRIETLRAAEPELAITKLKDMCADTVLVRDGQPSAAVVAPADKRYEKLAGAIVESVKKAIGAALPVLCDADVQLTLRRKLAQRAKGGRNSHLGPVDGTVGGQGGSGIDPAGIKADNVSANRKRQEVVAESRGLACHRRKVTKIVWQSSKRRSRRSRTSFDKARNRSIGWTASSGPWPGIQTSRKCFALVASFGRRIGAATMREAPCDVSP